MDLELVVLALSFVFCVSAAGFLTILMYKLGKTPIMQMEISVFELFLIVVTSSIYYATGVWVFSNVFKALLIGIVLFGIYAYFRGWDNVRKDLKYKGA